MPASDPSPIAAEPPSAAAGAVTRAGESCKPDLGLSWKANVIWVGVAAGAFHLSFYLWQTGFLVILYLVALLRLARNDTGRKAFYAGLGVGLLIAAGRLDFFWNIFGAGCPALWLVYAFWIGLFTALARFCYARFGIFWASCLIPFLWCGLEYFRSELYYLRFSWLSPGFAFALATNRVPLHLIGVYGLGFLLAGIASGFAYSWAKSKIQAFAIVASGLAFLASLWLWESGTSETIPMLPLHVAGVQMEFPSEQEVLVRLNEVMRKHPEAELLVLSEYTFDGPIPETVRNWCRANHRFLVAGGKDPAAGGNYYDTAFVVSPEGEMVFKQGKKVPIQFFKDGLPARTQELWNSPWGKLGICICYDLSYSRVTDRLVQLGAQGLIVPTMDLIDWGRRQHELHARVAPLRAAEYGIPIFRVASSGISQLIDCKGRIQASATCPGDGEIVSGVLSTGHVGRLPFDRWLAPAAAVVTGFIWISSLWHLFTQRVKPALQPKSAVL